MPRVDIPGVGLVDFPDTMGNDEVSEAAARLHDEASGQPAAPQSLSEQILARRAAAGQQTPQEELKQYNRSPMQKVGDAAIGAIGDTLPIAGAMAAAPFTEGASLIPAAGAIALGAGGGEAYRQLLNRATGQSDVPATDQEAANSIMKEGAVQGGITALTGGLAKGFGRLFGSGHAGQAQEIIDAAKAAGLNPNELTYSEASGSPVQKGLQNTLDKKTALGRAFAAQRAERLGANVRSRVNDVIGAVGPEQDTVAVGKGIIEEVPKGARASAQTHGQPFETLREHADAAGTTVDMVEVYNTAKTFQDEVMAGYRGAPKSGALSTPANNLLEDALTFRPLQAGGKSLSDITVPEARNFQTSINDILGNQNAPPDARRLAGMLKRHTRDALDAAYSSISPEDAALNKEANAGWVEHKRLYGKRAGGMAGKIASNPENIEAADLSGKLVRSPSDTADIMTALDNAKAPQVKAALKARMLREVAAPNGNVARADLTKISQRLEDLQSTLDAMNGDPQTAEAILKLTKIGKVTERTNILKPGSDAPVYPLGWFKSSLANTAAVGSEMMARLPLERKTQILRSLENGDLARYITHVIRAKMLTDKLYARAETTANDTGRPPMVSLSDAARQKQLDENARLSSFAQP